MDAARWYEQGMEMCWRRRSGLWLLGGRCMSGFRAGGEVAVLCPDPEGGAEKQEGDAAIGKLGGWKEGWRMVVDDEERGVRCVMRRRGNRSNGAGKSRR
jgi:hypothetical protein